MPWSSAEVSRHEFVLGAGGHSSQPSGDAQLGATESLTALTGHTETIAGGWRAQMLPGTINSRGSINIEIWLTIKIIIMRKQPHPAVTFDHYRHLNTNKLKQAARINMNQLSRETIFYHIL